MPRPIARAPQPRPPNPQNQRSPLQTDPQAAMRTKPRDDQVADSKSDAPQIQTNPIPYTTTSSTPSHTHRINIPSGTHRDQLNQSSRSSSRKRVRHTLHHHINRDRHPTRIVPRTNLNNQLIRNTKTRPRNIIPINLLRDMHTRQPSSRIRKHDMRPILIPILRHPLARSFHRNPAHPTPTRLSKLHHLRLYHKHQQPLPSNQPRDSTNEFG